MPDMQTALKEALNEWSDSAGRHQVEKQQPTPLPEVTQMQTANHVTTPTPRGRAPKPENEYDRREIFYHIKGNPDCSLQDLMECGFDANASTHLSVLYFNGKITRKPKRVIRPHKSGGMSERDVFVYTTAVSEYEDIPAVVPNIGAKKKRITNRPSKKQHVAAQPAQGIAALPTKMVEVKTKEQEQREYIAMIDAKAKPPRIALTASYVIDNISLSEAVLLHAELKKMLG